MAIKANLLLLYLRTIKFRAVLFKSIKISYLPMLLRFPQFLYVLLKSFSRFSYRRITEPVARNFISAAIFLARMVRRGAQARSDRQSLNPLKFKIPSLFGLNFKPSARLRRVQGEHKYARRLNGAYTKRSAPLVAPADLDKFQMRRRSCCDTPRHAFTNLALKYQFATCISAACRDTFLRTARLWRSSRGGTDQIYRGRE